MHSLYPGCFLGTAIGTKMAPAYANIFMGTLESKILSETNPSLPPFTTQMKEDLQKGKWLTDEHIQLAQKLLKAQFPHINGLQHSTFRGFLLCQSTQKYIYVSLPMCGFLQSLCNLVDSMYLTNSFVSFMYNTSPLTAITFCHISPNPMSVPKPFKYHLERTQTFGKKLIRIKIFVFEIAKVKVH